MCTCSCLISSESSRAHPAAGPFTSADQGAVGWLFALCTGAGQGAEGDSIGGKVRVGASGYPAGLGLPLYHKLEADIASAMMSINAVKAVEIGDGFEVVTQKGSEHRDEMLDEKSFLSNHAGGIVGGISTGQPIEVSIAVKPPSSIAVEGKTFTKDRKPTTVSVKGRHDPCVAIRAVPVAQAMLALVLLDHWCLSFHSQPLKKSTSN